MSKQTYYTDLASHNTWRVAIYLHEKGLKPEVKEISLLKGENKSAEFLAINPRHQLPVYQDGDITVTESQAILVYLEHKHHNHHPLIPTNDKDYGLFVTRFFQYAAKLDPTGFTLSVLFMNKTKAHLTDKIQALLTELKEWDRVLEGREYLANTFSIADIAILPSITSNVEILGLDLSQFPHLHAWYRRMWEKPSVKDTCTFVAIQNSIPHERVLEGVRL